MGNMQRQKACLRCNELFLPTGQNTKRCEVCRPEYKKEQMRIISLKHYVPKGRNQFREKNNNWKGGVAPSTYQSICFEAHGRNCYLCDSYAVLVHHLDEDRSNNTISNLRPMCKRCHQVGHNCTANLPKVVVFHQRECTSCHLMYQPTGPRGFTCGGCKQSIKV